MTVASASGCHSIARLSTCGSVAYTAIVLLFFPESLIPMLSISAAFDCLLATVTPLDHVSLSLSECLGLTLAADVAASADSPPFDKALMDGYAVRSADVVSGTALLAVVDLITAGNVPTKSVGQGEAIQIMTGAPLPTGADVVVKIEETEREGAQVRLATRSTTPGANILRRGTSVRAGSVVLQSGLKLNGSRIGALAELGQSLVSVYPRPTVAILATGDELVAIDEEPGPGQIRNSNQSMLTAQILAAGAVPIPLGVARDNRPELRAKIEQGLACDVLVLSGGVSAGMLDLVPSELAAAGVTEVFHKVEMKPGKPIWFGQRQAAGADRPRRTYVFGLPGNPVSSLVCCELFVRTAIRRLMGEPLALPQSIPARLEHCYNAKADRPTYHPACLTWSEAGPVVTLVPWHGSSDLCGTVAANGVVYLSGEPRQYEVGAIVETYPW